MSFSKLMYFCGFVCLILAPFTGLTDHEIYNLKLKMAAKKEKTLKKSK